MTSDETRKRIEGRKRDQRLAVSVQLTRGQAVFLDRVSGKILLETGKMVNRSAIIRALTRWLEDVLRRELINLFDVENEDEFWERLRERF